MAEQAEQLGAFIRVKSGAGPYSPPSAVAAALGVELRRCHLPGALRGYSMVRGQKILVHPSGAVAEEEFTAAHELVEVHLDVYLDEWHEAFCDRAAAAILLPAKEFLVELGGDRLDVTAVLRRWPWASQQSAIWRAAELEPRIAAGMWRGWRLKERRTLRRSSLSSAELAAVREAWLYERGEALVGQWRALAWWLRGTGRSALAMSLAVSAP